MTEYYCSDCDAGWILYPEKDMCPWCGKKAKKMEDVKCAPEK